MFIFLLICHWSLFSIHHIPPLIQIMDRLRQRDKPLSERRMVRLPRPQGVNIRLVDIVARVIESSKYSMGVISYDFELTSFKECPRGFVLDNLQPIQNGELSIKNVAMTTYNGATSGWSRWQKPPVFPRRVLHPRSKVLFLQKKRDRFSEKHNKLV